jgi:hypothetical protein
MSDDDAPGYVNVQTFEQPEQIGADERAEMQGLSLDEMRRLDGKGDVADVRDGMPRFPEPRVGKSNTGVKGVLQDFEEAKLRLRARRLEKKLTAERAISRCLTASIGSRCDDQLADTICSLLLTLHCRLAVGDERLAVSTPAAAPAAAQSGPDADAEDEFDWDDDADPFFEKYRAERLAALTQQQEQAADRCEASVVLFNIFFFFFNI